MWVQSLGWALLGFPGGKEPACQCRRHKRRGFKPWVVPTAWQDEALARDGVSREVPCSALKGYDGDLSLPLGLALGSPIFPSGCEGKLGVALESLQGLRDLT